jgi:hypothetical protein
MRRWIIFCLAILIVLLYQNTSAQLQAGAFLGFKSYSLKSVGTLTENGAIQTTPSADAGGTVFEFGGFGGYTPVSAGIYHLDLQLQASYSSIGFYERSYNSTYNSGQFSADGWSGATTSNIEIEVLGLNRISFPAFKLIEPYAGAGLSFDIMSTSDLGYGPPYANTSGTVAGKGQFKMGLVIAYGVIFNVAPFLSPYIQLRHLIPFGSETQLTNDPRWIVIIKDVPSYFSLTAGVRFDL